MSAKGTLIARAARLAKRTFPLIEGSVAQKEERAALLTASLGEAWSIGYDSAVEDLTGALKEAGVDIEAKVIDDEDVMKIIESIAAEDSETSEARRDRLMKRVLENLPEEALVKT